MEKKKKKNEKLNKIRIFLKNKGYSFKRDKTKVVRRSTSSSFKIEINSLLIQGSNLFKLSVFCLNISGATIIQFKK